MHIGMILSRNLLNDAGGGNYLISSRVGVIFPRQLIIMSICLVATHSGADDFHVLAF